MPIRARSLSLYNPVRTLLAGKDRALITMPMGGDDNVVDHDAASITIAAPKVMTLVPTSTVDAVCYIPGAVTLLIASWTVADAGTPINWTGTVTIVGRNQFGIEVTEIVTFFTQSSARTLNAFTSVSSVTTERTSGIDRFIEVCTRTDITAPEPVARVGCPFKLRKATDFLGYSGMGLGSGAPINLASTYDDNFHTFDITDIGVTIPQAGYVLLKDDAIMDL